jgi:hypothetical protein
VYSEQFNINLPSFVSEYVEDDTQRIQELIAQYKEGWQQLDKPEPGCLVLFRILGTESHVGIAVSDSHFLHARQGQASAIESFESRGWASRIVGYFKYTEKSSTVLNLMPHPLRTQRFTVVIEPGTKLSELVPWIAKEYSVPEEIRSRIIIMLNGRVTDPGEWAVTTLKETDQIEYRAIPLGGSGGGIFRMIAMIAIAIAAPYAVAYMAGYGATAAGITAATAAMGAGTFAAATMAVSLVGSMLINAIAPIRPPDQPRQSDPGSSERQLMITGAGNQANKYGAIPVILGKVKLTPPLGAQNFISYENDRDTYLTMLLVWGYGPLQIDAATLKIGDVAISNFILSKFSDGTDKLITLDRQTTPTSSQLTLFNAIYGNDILQVSKNLTLVCDGNPEGTTTTTQTGTDEEGNPIYDSTITQPTPGPYSEAASTGPVNKVSVAIHFSQGLRKIKAKGNGAGDSYATPVVINYQVKIGTADWVQWKRVTYGGDAPKKDAFTVTETYDLPTPQLLQVRVRRETGDNTEDNPDWRYAFETIFLTATFTTNTSPAVDPKNCAIAKTALQVKANEQLSNSIEGINAIVQTYALNWNGIAWTMAATNNPASLFRYVLQHPGNPQRILDSEVADKINLTQLQYWHTYCAQKGFTFNRIQAEAKSVLETLRDICAAGRASPALVDGKWTVVIDEPKANIVQHFSPHNSWGFEGTRALPRLPDALRITYFDEDQDYQEAEIIVYAVGKSQANAELFESIQLPGVTKSTLVVDHARWHMAQAQLRRESYVLNADIEYIVANRGDRVKVTHDVPMWGLGSGRIKNKISGTILELDELVPIDDPDSHTIRIRSSTGTSAERTLKQQFIIGAVVRIDNIVTVILDQLEHPLNVGDSVRVLTTVPGISTNTAKITAVTNTTFSYVLAGANVNWITTTGIVRLNDGYYSKIQVEAILADSDAASGDLFLFGKAQKESQDLIIMNIEPTTNKSARITLVDYGVTDTYNIFTDYLTLTAAQVFQTNITKPPELLQNSFSELDVPVVTKLQSDDLVADIISPGVYSYKICVSYANSKTTTLNQLVAVNNLPTNVHSVECQYDISSSTSSSNYRTITVPFLSNTINIPNVIAGETYKIRLRYVSLDGRVGSWSNWITHTVVGKIANYNTVENITVVRKATNLIITPVVARLPDDFNHYEIRVYKDSGTGDFWTSTNASIKKYTGTGAVTVNLNEFSKPRISAAGTKYRIACRMIDNIGNSSTTSALTSITLYTIAP